MTSKHYREDRKQREAVIQEIGLGTVIKIVTIDRGHVNGPEDHEITSTGIILVYNHQTRKMVTKLIARPAQLRRYYNENEIIPENLLAITREHARKKLYNL